MSLIVRSAPTEVESKQGGGVAYRTAEFLPGTGAAEPCCCAAYSRTKARMSAG